MAEITGTNLGTTTSGGVKNGQELLEDKVKTEEQKRYDVQWFDEAENKLGSLSTSNQDVLAFIKSTLTSDKHSAAQDAALQYLLNMRSQTITMMSNMLKAIHDGAMAVIHNIGR